MFSLENRKNLNKIGGAVHGGAGRNSRISVNMSFVFQSLPNYIIRTITLFTTLESRLIFLFSFMEFKSMKTSVENVIYIKGKEPCVSPREAPKISFQVLKLHMWDYFSAYI